MMNILKSSDYIGEGGKQECMWLLMYGGEGGCEGTVVKVDVKLQEGGEDGGKNGLV